SEDLRAGAERISAPALDRFLEQIDVFPTRTAGQLMIVYRGITGIASAIRTPQIDGAPLTDQRAQLALQSVAGMAAQTEDWIYAASDSLSESAEAAGFNVIATQVVR